MKCPVCHNDKIILLGVWYVPVGTDPYTDWYILKTHYGCESCRALIQRPVTEESYHYMKADGSIIMRSSQIPEKRERRLHVVDMDPGFVVRK